MRFRTLLITAIFLTQLGAVGPAIAMAAGPLDLLTCSLSVEVDEPGAYEPIWLDVACENHRAAEYTLLLGKGGPLGIALRPRPAESPESSCEMPESENACGGYDYILGAVPSHGKATVRVPLHRWFRLQTPGEFTATLVACDGVQRSREGSESAPLRGVTFKILPADEPRLALLCARMEREALGDDTEKATQAARELGSIDHPIAVPYLKRVLAANVFASSSVVPGLAKMHTLDAVTALIEAYDKTSGFTPLIIRQCLADSSVQVDDPITRRRLDSILAATPEIVE